MSVPRGTLRKTKHCSECKGARDRPGQAYCKKCQAEYMRKWRAGQPDKGDLTKTLWRVDVKNPKTGVYERMSAEVTERAHAETFLHPNGEDRLVKIEVFETVVPYALREKVQA